MRMVASEKDSRKSVEPHALVAAVIGSRRAGRATRTLTIYTTDQLAVIGSGTTKVRK
jgi:hypothetical protein